ncbi:DUF5916 domain-containing protein [Paucihalobacter sp.]|uniref:DUF5916 domain-containing protein n=1 Tax=Paucihalobacter sp. TaxID=2850405 RepID=UPI002FE2F6F5
MTIKVYINTERLFKILIICMFVNFITVNSLSAQSKDKKVLNIIRAVTPPIIDGILNDDIWQRAEKAQNFTQYKPDIGIRETDERTTLVQMSFDDQALYIAAYLKDDPKLMMTQLTNRDNFGQTDYFKVVINPNNDAQNDTQFIVFSSGVQADAIANPTINEDFGWNAVWDSAVTKTDDGWIVEMKLPYRTLRFSDEKEPIWGIQFIRFFRRERSEYAWNPIDPTKGIVGLYHGELKGLKDIEPPVRLNLYPFTTGILNTFDDQTDTKLTFGMDVKYGLTDNFTLDATLVPDFSQARFDDVVLNLGPFEQTFAEQRQFFTEGVDLFSKGNLFFSRRVGSAPIGSVTLDDNQEITDRPQETKVLNALKISGRTKKGLGIGLFNAITESTFATIRDTITNEGSKQLIEPLSNYNILVVDQQFNNNSSVSLINTNVLREGSFRDANVTAALFDIVNKRNTYNIAGDFKMSRLNLIDDNQVGYSSSFSAAKVHGNFRYGVFHNYADTDYDINDLGLQFRNNFNNVTLNTSYQTFEPTKRLNSYNINLSVSHQRLASPGVYTGTSINTSFRANSKKLDTYGLNLNFQPGKQYDYFEARTENSFFIYENFLNAGMFISSNYNRVFAVDLRANVNTLFEDGRDYFTYNLDFSPRVRFNDHFLLVYNVKYDFRGGDRGFATRQDNQPIFGERDRQIVENSLSANYTFNPFQIVSLTFRNYWDTVSYEDNFFTLLDNGRLTTDYGYTLNDLDNDPNINFTTWNLDLSYSWQFAPGSFLTALYRNQLFNISNDAQANYSDTLNNLFNSPTQHTFSVRVQYFIDYANIKSVFSRKNS